MDENGFYINPSLPSEWVFFPVYLPRYLGFLVTREEDTKHDD